jgi:TolB-like protein
VAEPTPRAPTVFVSYASQDREAARRLGDALPAFGLEVWYDESELGGGDAWDQKIRRQIRECDYFMPLVSAQTEGRHEGYFRREWRLAVERTLDMADDHPFLLPVVIDDTDAALARVPEKFFAVQWLRVPDGAPNAALESLCRRLVSGDIFPKPASAAHPLSRDTVRSAGTGAAAEIPGSSGTPSTPSRSGSAGSPASPGSAPSAPSPPSSATTPHQALPFPVHEPGQSVRFGFDVLIWCVRSLWALFKLLPRWIRYILIVWFLVVVWPHSQPRKHDVQVAATQEKLNDVAAQYHRSPKDLAKLGTMVAKEFADSVEEDNTVSLLAMPFSAPAGDAEASKLADAAFAQIYTRISVTQHGAPVAGDSGITQCDQKTLVARGHAKHTRYVLCGIVETAASAPAALAITLIDVEAAHELWSGSYPVAGADPAKIAQDVAAQVPKAESDD